MAYRGFENRTPFAAEPFLLADEEGARLLTLVAKATWDVSPKGRLTLAEEQAPIHRVPVHHGEPGRSSLRHEHETAFVKVAADVVLLGHAQPERGSAAELDVSLRVGSLRKQVKVFGDRFWRHGLGGRSISAPRRFEAMPLVYERAFGGSREHASEPRNPVGTGFVAPADHASPDPHGDEIRLPNLEDPARLIRDELDTPAPAGFGFVSPDWAPRRQLAGTFDDAWRETRFPRLPADFDRRHLNAAPVGQQMRAFEGGEAVEVVNVSRRGPIRFELPRCALGAVAMLRDGGRRAAPMALDTLIIDADAHRVHAVFRASLGIHGRVHDLEWSRVEVEGGPTHG